VSTGTDAWNTPGWSAQQPVYLASADSSVVLPAGVHPVTVTGSYVGPKGGAQGTVRFTPKTQSIQVGTVEVILAPVRFEVRKGELLTASLTVVPQDVVWEVRESVGPVRESYAVTVPSTAVGPIDITELARVPA
jgi:hypothetical protein